MKILIATDGSDYSKAAIKECARTVNLDNAEVLIISAYEDAYPITAEPFALSAEYYEKLDEAVRSQSISYIDDARKYFKEACPEKNVTVKTELLHGVPDQQIIDRAKEWGADLIIVGSHGRGFWGRLLGSVSNAVVHHAPCSVMVVRK